MKRVELDIDGKKIEVWAEKIQGRLWFHHEGKTRVIEKEGGGRRSTSKSQSSHPGKILSPMPGKILKVAVGLNQIVRVGETLLVMEAMKMEYSLQADIDGKVKQLNCKVGDQVGLGTLLVSLAAEM